MRNQAEEQDSPLILVVDDFEDNRAMYVEYLQFHKFRVVEAVNGAEAVERTREHLPLIVVMDLSLPVMDGWEATRRIKADPTTEHIRVIALTGHAEPAHAKKALDAGCDDFVPKPCLPETLLSKIRDQLPGGKASGTRRKGASTNEATAAPKPKMKGKK